MSDVDRICRLYVWHVRPSQQSKRRTCCNWQLHTIIKATAHNAMDNCTQSNRQRHMTQRNMLQLATVHNLQGNRTFCRWTNAHNPYGNRTCCNGQLHNVSPQGPPHPSAVCSASSSHHSLQGVLPCSEKNSCNLIQPMLTRQHHEAA